MWVCSELLYGKEKVWQHIEDKRPKMEAHVCRETLVQDVAHKEVWAIYHLKKYVVEWAKLG
jgi:hypothetical protein